MLTKFTAINNSSLMGISIAAIALALVALAVASMGFSSVEEEIEVYTPQNREIWLFSQVDEHIEEEFEIPPDMFSQDTIVVNQGDKVKIHFYNLEPPETQEHHTFTINAPEYQIHNDINAGESTTVEFTATKSGIFEYICTYHQPTMRGELVVLPSDD